MSRFRSCRPRAPFWTAAALLLPAFAASGGEYRAVIVGVNLGDLEYCDDDAIDLKDALLCDGENWTESNIELLIDSDATFSNVEGAMTTMSTAAGLDDVCVFYFSGHGGRRPDKTPEDEADGEDEVLVAWDDDIYDDDLADWLEAFASQHICVMVDTCFSGGMTKSSGAPLRAVKGDGFAADLVRKYAAGKAASRALAEPVTKATGDTDLSGLVVLMACDDDEVSMEYPSLANGLFTFFIVEGMRQASTDTGGDGFVSAEEAFEYAGPRVQQFDPDQTPQLYDQHEGDLDLLLAGDYGTGRVAMVEDLPFGGGCVPAEESGAGPGAAATLALGVLAPAMLARGRRTRRRTGRRCVG